MNPLGRASRELVAAARGADGPRPGTERRVWRALATSSAAGLVSVGAQAALAATPATLAAVPIATTSSALAVHLIAGAMVGTALTATVDVVVHLASPAPIATPGPIAAGPVVEAPLALPPAPRLNPVPELPVSAKASATGAPPTLAGPRSLADEAARLERALHGASPEATLAELAEYERAYPAGALREEARAAHALAVCASGRGAEGHLAVERFATEYPASPLLPRVQSGCARARAAVGEAPARNDAAPALESTMKGRSP